MSGAPVSYLSSAAENDLFIGLAVDLVIRDLPVLPADVHGHVPAGGKAFHLALVPRCGQRGQKIDVLKSHTMS